MLEQECTTNGLFPSETRDFIATFYLKAGKSEVLKIQRHLELGHRYEAMMWVENAVAKGERSMMGSKNLIWGQEGVKCRQGAAAKMKESA